MYQSQNYYQNIGTAGHRASASVNYLSHYNYYDRAAPMPTSSHYLPPNHLPTSQGVLQSQIMQPTMVGMVPPPALLPAAQPEPATGGINAVLEYDLPTMSTFLSWCAFGMLKQSRNPTKDFEGLVNSVLFATRLPKSTIIIALEYMNQRFSHAQLEFMTESDIFVKLITGLILANKFNDDNTFTNRSWCGATGLAIQLLNDEEKHWLKKVNWQLNVVNFESNIITLEECWKTWLEKYSVKEYTYKPASIPSSPIADYYSPVNSSPVKDIWSSSANSNIWSFSNYQYTPTRHPLPYANNFVPYPNSYYINMASC